MAGIETKALVNSRRTSTALLLMVDGVHDLTEQVLDHYAEKARDFMVQLAPMESGDLRSSIEIHSIEVGRKIMGAVGRQIGPTSLPYARRMDLGLHHPDSRGRVYNQKGKHFKSRTQTRIKPEFHTAMTEAWTVGVHRTRY